MKKITLLLFVIMGLFIYNDVAAQKYESSAGLRGGFASGVSYKKFLNETKAFEVALGAYGFNGFMAMAQYQHHFPLDNSGIANLDWYYGIGAHAGSWGSWGFGNEYFMLGGNGVLGVDYVFEEIPINVSVDFGPAVNILKPSHRSLVSFIGGVAVRYILK